MYRDSAVLRSLARSFSISTVSGIFGKDRFIRLLNIDALKANSFFHFFSANSNFSNLKTKQKKEK